MDPIYRPGAISAFPKLRDEQILLRNWTYEDLPCIEEASRDQVIPTITTVPSPFSEEAGRAFVERQWKRQASGEGLSLANLITKYPACSGRCDDGKVYSA